VQLLHLPGDPTAGVVADAMPATNKTLPRRRCAAR
jgi:hypothetical protein